MDGLVPIDVVLSEIAQLCIETSYLRDIYDFYLLHHAYEDLKDDEDQYFLPKANRANIDRIVEAYCRKWIRAHGSP